MFGYRKFNIFFIVTAIFFISMDVAVLINQMPLAPWLSLLVILFFSIFLFIRGKSEGFPIIAASTIAPFLLSFVIILFRVELLDFIKTIPDIQNIFRPAYVFLILCLLVSIFLVVVMKHDLRFDKTTKESYYLQFGAMNKTISIIKVWMKYFVFSNVVTFILSWIWNMIEFLPAYQIFPEFNFAGFKLNQMVSVDWFWRTATLFVVILFVIDIIRNLRTPLWDVFISYKSQNVDIARGIANRLIASDKKVWFAEYQILLTERSKFQKAIDRGIRQSRFGIALTNDEYARSDYCGLEMKQLIKHCGPKRILEIKIPEEPLTHQKYSPLSKAHQFVYHGDLEECFTFITKRTGWWISPALEIPAISKKEKFEGICVDQPYQIDVSGWELVERSFHGGGPCYRRQVELAKIYWNLQYGEEYSPEVYESRSSLSQKNDRQLYNMLVDYANHYFRDLKAGSIVQGVHLFFLHNLSHFAVTYLVEGIWKRRYSIMLIHPLTGKAAEFLFTFEFSGDFPAYCRASHIMDELVRTLVWSGSTPSLKTNTSTAIPSPSSQPDRMGRLIEDQAKVNRLNSEGLGFAKRGLLEYAIASWKKALTFSMDNELKGQILFNLGRANEKQGQIEQAIEHYQNCVQINPAQFNALCNIGSIYMDKGDHYKALEYLLAAEKINPTDDITLNNLVDCYNELEDYDEAIKWKKKLNNLSN